MPECGFCGDGFENDRKLHLHWEEEHGEELNSHQEEKVKKARREKQEEEKASFQKRKKIAGWGLAGILAFGVVAAIGFQLVNSGPASQTSSFQLEQQPAIGSPNATVTVVEFGDYRCPFCRQFELSVFPRLKENYIDTGKVRFYFVNYAFLGPGSTQAAVAGECVYSQDESQFWDFHHSLYQNQGPESERWVTADLLVGTARNSTEGIDYQELRSCIQDRRTVGKVNKDLRIGKQNSVTSTPTVFVNGKTVRNWRYSSLKAAIESELG